MPRDFLENLNLASGSEFPYEPKPRLIPISIHIFSPNQYSLDHAISLETNS